MAIASYRPYGPWDALRRIPGHPTDAVAFAEKYGLKEIDVQWAFMGFGLVPPSMIPALSAETGMSEAFFRNLNNGEWPNPTPPSATPSGVLVWNSLFCYPWPHFLKVHQGVTLMHFRQCLEKSAAETAALFKLASTPY